MTILVQLSPGSSLIITPLSRRERLPTATLTIRTDCTVTLSLYIVSSYSFYLRFDCCDNRFDPTGIDLFPPCPIPDTPSCCLKAIVDREIP